MSVIHRFVVLIAVIGIFSSGCSRNDGFERLVLTGEVTHNGRPVPSGSIWFEPDASVGKYAPTGYAMIQNGKFQTALDSSPIQGVHTIRINGFSEQVDSSSQQAKHEEEKRELLFPEYETIVELRSDHRTLIFSIPGAP
ncbi:MAG TPA: hypothetical protein VNQ76_03080 [Planctomicrobium sp.]|nr:hypothetical protein [Planctomicrobium sp.]